MEARKKLTKPQLPASIFHLLFGCRPALFHQGEQMLQGVLIAAALFSGELAGTFVELRGHLSGFFGRTTEGDENLG